MKAKTSAYVKFAAAAVLAAGSSFVQAQQTNCSVSGEDGVYACDDGVPPPCGQPYTLNYTGNQLVYVVPGQACPPLSTCSSDVIGDGSSNVLQLPGFGLTFSKLNGNLGGFNHAVFTNHWGTACGTLVDTSGDGQADELVMQMGAYAGRGGIPVIYSFPLSFPKNFVEVDNTFYWSLQILKGWTSYLGPLNFFTPVNQNGISLSCDDNGKLLALEVNGRTNARSQGPCATNAIPTATFWGYAAITLLLMFAGMRLLRKGGFGDDFNLRA